MEVQAFVERRGESTRKRPAEKWKAMLENEWMTVIVEVATAVEMGKVSVDTTSAPWRT